MKISDKTFNTATNYQKEVIHINKENRDFLETEIDKLEVKKKIANRKIARVKIWLQKVNEEERFVLNEYYIENSGKNWSKVLDMYQIQFNIEKTQRALRIIRDKALEKILNITNV